MSELNMRNVGLDGFGHQQRIRGSRSSILARPKLPDDHSLPLGFSNQLSLVGA